MDAISRSEQRIKNLNKKIFGILMGFKETAKDRRGRCDEPA